MLPYFLLHSLDHKQRAMATGNKIFSFFYYATNHVAHSTFKVLISLDIGRTRSDLFSSRVKTFSRQSAAPRLIASPFFNTSFFIFGERKSRQVSKQRNPYFRRAQQPAGGSPFLRHLSLFFHGNSFSRSGRGNHRPSLSVLPSLREHGLSVRMSQSLLTFSGGVRSAAVCGIQGLRPSFFRLYEQFFIIH